MIKESGVRNQTDGRTESAPKAAPTKVPTSTTAKANDSDRKSHFAKREASGRLKRSVTRLLSDDESGRGSGRAKGEKTPHSKTNKQQQKQLENVARQKAERTRRAADEKARSAEVALLQAAAQKAVADLEVSKAETLVSRARQQAEVLKRRAGGLSSQKAATYVTAARELQTQASSKKSEAESLQLAAESALYGAAALKAKAEELRLAAEREQAALAALMKKNAEDANQPPIPNELHSLPMVVRVPGPSAQPRLISPIRTHQSLRTSLTSLAPSSTSASLSWSDSLGKGTLGNGSVSGSLSSLSIRTQKSEWAVNSSMMTEEILEKLEHRISRASAEVSRSLPGSAPDRSVPEDASASSTENDEHQPAKHWERDEEPRFVSGDQSREYQSRAREKELQKERTEREKIRREGIRHRAEMDSIYAGGSHDRSARLRSGSGGPPLHSKLERDKRAGIEDHFKRIQDSSLPLEWSAWSEDQRWERERG